jgi:hypothetical protein
LRARTVDLDFLGSDVLVHQGHWKSLDCLGQKFIQALSRIVLTNGNDLHIHIGGETVCQLPHAPFFSLILYKNIIQRFPPLFKCIFEIQQEFLQIIYLLYAQIMIK